MKTTISNRLRQSLSATSSLMLVTMIASAANAQTNSIEIAAQSKNSYQQPANFYQIKDTNSTSVIHPNGTYQVQIGEQQLSRAKPSSNYIYLRRGGRFDPLQQKQSLFNDNNQARVPELYTASSQSTKNTFIVQFHTQALPDYQAAIKLLGGTVASSFPPNSLLVLIDAKNTKKLQKLSSVRAVVPFLPIHKLQEGLEDIIADNSSNQFDEYSVMAITRQHTLQLEKFISSIGGVFDPQRTNRMQSVTSRMSVKLTPTQLLQVVQSPLTLFVDQLGDADGEDVDNVREREGFDWLESITGYTGQGVGLEVYDRGFQINHQELSNTPNPLLVRSPQPEGSGGADHGTDISGILFAQGVNAKYRGLLPDAARPIVFSRYSGFSSGQPSEAQLRSHLSELVDPNGAYRAVVQTSSTDYATTLNYTTWSAEYDEVLFDIDLIKTQSQSNTGNQNSRPAAWSKNVVSVGGIKTVSTVSRSDDTWGNGASIGPAADGRIKPDLSGQYDAFDMIADGSGSTYNSRSGTSFSTPAIAGAFGIFFQMWADGVFDGGPGKQGAPEYRDVFDVKPHAATAKAMMIHTAFQYEFNSGDSHNLSRIKQGWGFPDLKNLYQTAQNYQWQLPILINEDDLILPGATNSYTMTMDGSQPLKATLVYKDPRGNPAASVARINDLSLKVTSPNGTIYWGNNGLRQGIWSTPGGNSNTVDTVENVFIQAPQAGTWQVEVLADDLVQDGHPQTSALDADYALIATGGVSSNSPPVSDAGNDQSIQLPNSVNLNGSVTDDAFPGNPVSSTWSKVSGPGTVNFANANATATSATFSSSGSYVLQLSATDGEFTHADSMTVTVSPPPQNQAPIAFAGNDQTIEYPATANLNGSCNDDGLPVGASVSANWSGNGVSFANASSQQTSASFGSAGNYSITLTCNDSALTASDTLIITVNAAQTNQAPIVNAGADFSAIVGASINLNGSASDDGRPAGGSLTTSWSRVSGPASVTFSDSNNLSSAVTFSAAGNYVLSLAASDGALTSNDQVNVSVTATPQDLTNDSFETDLGNWSNPASGDDYDWTRNSGGTTSSSTGPNSGASGSNWYMYLETSNGSGAYTAGDTAILESTSVNGSNRSFSFDYHMYGANMGTLNVEISNNGSAWVNVWSLSGQQQNSNAEAYQHANIDLSAYSGALKVRFKAVAAGNYRGDMAIDNAIISGINTPPVNQAPTANAGSDLNTSVNLATSLNGVCSDDGLPQANSLTASWTGDSGTTFSNANSATTSVSFTATGSYSVTLTCSDGALTTSDNAQITVTDTPPAPVTFSSDDFESGLGNWVNNSVDDSHDWTRDSNGTPSSSTGPTQGANGSSYYIYLETSNGSGAFNSGNTAYLESGIYSGNSRTLSFDYHFFGADIGNLAVDVFVNGNWITNVWQLSAQQQSSQSEAYRNASVDLSSYSGNLRLRFRATATGGWKGDIALDNIQVSGFN